MSIQQKSDSSRNDDYIRVLYKQPVFDSYKRLCRLRRTQKIDYVDFEWKYFQCYHGNQNLTIEKSQLNSSPLTFYDLPMDALEKVMEHVDISDRLALRKVSHDLQNLVDSSKVYCPKIVFHFKDLSSRIDFDNLKLTYEEDDGFCKLTCDNRWPLKPKEYEKDRNHHEMMMTDAKTILKNPNLRIGLLVLNIDRIGLAKKLLKFLESLNFQLDVRSIEISSFAVLVLPILQFLRQERLEEIKYDTGDSTTNQLIRRESLRSIKKNSEELNRIAQTEQWRKARKLWWYQFPENFRMENLLHFKEIIIRDFSFTDKNLFMVKDILFKSPHLELCNLISVTDVSWWPLLGWETAIHKIVRVMSEDPAYNRETRRFSIPNSDDYFQLEFLTNDSRWMIVRITKISKN